MTIVVSKFSAIGNDYLVIDPNISDFCLNKEAIRKICDRNNGIGSDGILYGPLDSESNSLRIFNPDGTECEKSGNGLRIFADYLYRKGYVQSDTFQIQLPSETIEVYGIDQDNGIYKIDMGTPTLNLTGHDVKWTEHNLIDQIININGFKIYATFISIGNPHLVVEVDSVSADLAQTLGPVISNLDMFPKRTNVQFCKVVNRGNIQIEIYERGAGYTLASGSSSCAAVSAMYFQDKVDSNVQIQMPGGVLETEFVSDGRIFLTGESRFIFDGFISDNFQKKLEPATL